jgi:hypothetical protein
MRTTLLPLPSFEPLQLAPPLSANALAFIRAEALLVIKPSEVDRQLTSTPPAKAALFFR